MTDQSNSEYWTLLTQLNSVLADRSTTAATDLICLRDAVCAYVTMERARGTTLAAILLTVEEILESAGKESTSASDALARQIIDWCIEFHGPVAVA